MDKKVDIELIKLTLEDSDNFSFIIDKYEQKLFQYIMRLGDFSIQEWEDILQDAFIKVYTHLNEYDETFPFSSWIYRITHNITIDTFRKNNKKATIRLDDSLYEWIKETLASESDLCIDLKNKDMKGKVQDSLELLTFEQKEVIILKYVEWKEYEEISDILQIPIGTVWTLVHRAKKQLRWNLTPIHNHI